MKKKFCRKQEIRQFHFNFHTDFSADLEAKWDGIEEHLNAVPNGDLDTLYIVYNSGAGSRNESHF